MTTRRRRSLVKLSSFLKNSIQTMVYWVFPTIGTLSWDIFDRTYLRLVIKRYTAPSALLAEDSALLVNFLREHRIPRAKAIAAKLLQAASASPSLEAHSKSLPEHIVNYLDLLETGEKMISRYNRDIALMLAQTSGVVLLSMPRISVTTAAEYLAEISPPERFETSSQITAAAGLVPSRYQSGRRDCRGPITKIGHPLLRDTLVQIGKDLDHVDNPYFHRYALALHNRGKNKKDIAVRLAPKG